MSSQYVEDNPPLDLLPKSFMNQEDLPKSGGPGGLLKLTKFRGRDHGKSKIAKDDQYEWFEFPQNIQTLK